MPLIHCPDCNQEVSDQATACPKCAFPISSLASQRNSALTIQWESEDENYVSVKCPKCGKISNVNKANLVFANATMKDINYTVNGHGTCSCGLRFDKIVKSIEVEDSSKTNDISQSNHFGVDSNGTKTKSKIKWWGWLIILFILLSFMNTCNSSAPAPKSTQSTNAPTTASSNNTPSVPANKYSDSQINSAKKIMENVRQLANVFEDGPMLVVEFNQYLFPDDVNKRLQFVRAVADADAILNGEARSIYFYNPGNKKFAKADRFKGVRLED